MDKKSIKKILFLGNFHLSEINVKKLLKDLDIIGFECEFLRDFNKIKNRFSYNNYSSKKYEVIVVGQVPHKSHGTGNGRSLTSDICTSESEVPVYVCRDDNGSLKGTKKSLSKVFEMHFKLEKIISDNIEQ